MTKSEREMRKELIELRNRNADLEDKILHHADLESQWAVERARLAKQIAGFEATQADMQERIGWIRSLVDGTNKNPLDLGIRKLKPGQNAGCLGTRY